MLSKEQLVLACIISVIIFIYSLEISLFNGYTIVGLIIFGIMLYFGIYEIFKQQRSMLSLVIISIVAIIIFVIVWSGYMVYVNKQKINKDWPQYKCKPYILPFAGWAVGPSGISATSNFTDCMWTINKSFFDILISPFTEILKTITDILGNIVNDIQNIRKMISYMRDNMEEIARDTQQKIWDSYERIAFLFKTFLNVFSKLGQVFKDLFEMMEYTFYTMASLWNGPIGSVANFFCFDAETLVTMYDGKKKMIKDIKVGEYLQDNNMVKAVLILSGKYVEMFKYKNIKVAGDHLVKENEKWIRVNQSQIKDIKKVDNIDIIYCLITENSQIKIDNIIFADYMETHDKIIMNGIYEYILAKLNNNNDGDCDNMINTNKKENRNIKLESGIDGDAMINKIKIKDIKIGDYIDKECGKVIGKIELSYDKDDIYEYQNIIMSGNIIIYDNDNDNDNNNDNYNKKWIPVYMLKDVKKVEYNKKMYNIITEGGIIKIGNNIIIRDFEQIGDENINDTIDKYVLDILNK